MKNAIFKLSIFIILTAVLKDALAADTASGSSVLPYETWLKTIQKSLTGPVAFSVSLIGIVSCGATLIFTGGEMGRFMRSIVYLVMVMTLLVGANTLMSSLFNGATVELADTAHTEPISKDKKDPSDNMHSVSLYKNSKLSSRVNISTPLIDSPEVWRAPYTGSFNEMKNSTFNNSFSFSFYKNESLKSAC